MVWNPDIYSKFQEERLMSMKDILPLLEIRPNLEIIDLGCGPGTLTEHLTELFPGCSTLGIDSSEEMLGKARRRMKNNLKFTRQLIEEITGEWDLVFSHSAIQWIGQHKSLIPKLCSLVKPGGQLVIQFPSLYQHPIHVLMRETAMESPFREALGGWVRESVVLLLEEYAELMHQHLGENVNVFSKIYMYRLDSIDILIEWLLGTSLIPYLDKMPIELHELFIRKYKIKLDEIWGKGQVSYLLTRFFLIGKSKNDRLVNVKSINFN
jgi:trans-aconitate 2-methyltransferase